tara:strand:- start:1895 stop:2491 length:597 start_codon:yes stop_codon:yes gene_type:complete
MKTIYFVILSVFLSQAAFAEDCSDYPYSKGVNVILVDDGTKILSTAMTSVLFDDMDLYVDALEEAELEAKASISKFLEEEVAKSCTTDKSIISLVNISNQDGVALKTADATKVKSTLCRMSSTTQSVLRGAVVIGSCYTPGEQVRVTVGIKPETTAAAKELSNSMEKSINYLDSSEQTNGSTLTSVDGYSNTDQLSEF